MHVSYNRWTIEALKEHYDELLEQQHKYYERIVYDQSEALKAALAAADKAVTKSEGEAKAWQAASNEWRGAMTDRERNFVTFSTFKEYQSSVDEKIANLSKWAEHNYGKATGLRETVGWVVGGIGLLALLIGIVERFKPG